MHRQHTAICHSRTEIEHLEEMGHRRQLEKVKILDKEDRVYEL